MYLPPINQSLKHGVYGQDGQSLGQPVVVPAGKVGSNTGNFVCDYCFKGMDECFSGTKAIFKVAIRNLSLTNSCETSGLMDLLYLQQLSKTRRHKQ